jgi:ADP-ribose pyrophosphatase YjhB (NUDIX family)
MTDPVHIAAVTALVSNPDGDILLIRDHRCGWVCPGGQVEQGETVPAALAREIMEETGITAAIGPLAGIYTNITPPCLVIFAFLAHYVAGTPQITDESLETIWVSRERARELVTLPNRRDQLNDLLTFTGRPTYRAYRYDTATPYQIIEERTI